MNHVANGSPRVTPNIPSLGAASLGMDEGSATVPRMTKNTKGGDPMLMGNSPGDHTLQRGGEPRLDWGRDSHDSRSPGSRAYVNSRTSPSHRPSPSHQHRSSGGDFRSGDRDWDSVPATRNPSSSGRDSMLDSGTPPPPLQTMSHQPHHQGLSIYDMENGVMGAAMANHRDKGSLSGGADMMMADGSAHMDMLDMVNRDGSSPLYEYHHKRKGEPSPLHLVYQCTFSVPVFTLPL